MEGVGWGCPGRLSVIRRVLVREEGGWGVRIRGEDRRMEAEDRQTHTRGGWVEAEVRGCATQALMCGRKGAVDTDVSAGKSRQSLP